MADDSKPTKPSLPPRPADAPNPERRSRPPVRGANAPRTQRQPEPRNAPEGRERGAGQGRGNDERPRGGYRNNERPQREGRSFDERRPRNDRPDFGDRPRRNDDRPARSSFSPRPENERRGFGDRLPREEFRGTAGRNVDSRFDERRPREDRPPRRDGERPQRSFQDRGPQGRDDRRPYGDRGDRPQRDFRDNGDDRRFGQDRHARADGERGSRRPAFEGRDDNRQGERRPYGERKEFSRDAERRPWSAERPQRNERSFGERDGHSEERRPWSAERPQRSERSFGERDGHREERRPYGERSERPAFRDGDRPRYADRGADERRGYGERAPRPAFRDENRPRPDHASRDADERGGFRSRPPRHEDAPRSYGERPRRDVERDGPAPAPTFGDDIHSTAPRGNSFGRSRGEPRPERAPRPRPPEHFANAPAALPVDAPDAMRLSKRMSELGLCSRREADEYIERGWVTVDGEVVAELGAKVTPGQKIELNAVAEEMQMRRITILINKPIGYVSGQAEDGYEPAAVLVTPENHWSEDPVHRRYESRIIRKLAPAGRLDIDSTGLLVLTQDGRVAKQLIGEYSDVEKEYLVRVEGELSADGMRLLHHGLTLDGVELLPAKVSWQNEDQLRFVLQEGRKRQIRRMCEMVGLKVVGLKRIRIGRIPLGKLPVGQWRYLGEHENF